MATITITDSASLNNALTTVNDGFDELRQKMQLFLSSFDAHVQQRRDGVLSSRQEYLKGVAADREAQNDIQHQIEAYQATEMELAKTLEKERLEISEVKSSIEDFEAQKENLTSNRNRLQKEIEEMRKKIQKRREFRHSQRHALESQSAKNVPELNFYEDKLAMKIYGVRQDVLQFVFTHINDSDWSREYSFVVDVATREYNVTECEPRLPQLEQLVSELNSSRNFYAFLKQMRQAFKDHASNGKQKA